MGIVQGPNQRYYFTHIESEADRQSKLKQFFRGQRFTLWERGGGEGDTEEFSLREVSLTPPFLLLSHRGNLFQRIKGPTLKGKEVFFWTDLKGLRYFSSSDLRFDLDHSLYRLDVGDLYVAQKRNDYRLDMKAGKSQAIFRWDGQDFPSRDISAGGLSFLVCEKKSKMFEGRTKLEDCQVFFNGVDFPIGRVCIVKTWPHEGGTRGMGVSVQFQGVKPVVEERLVRAIMREARALEAIKGMALRKKNL